MAEEQSQSIADRIASLKLNQVGQPGLNQAANGVWAARPKPPPPPRPSARPALPARPTTGGRAQSTNVPPVQDYNSISTDPIGNQPERALPSCASTYGMDGISRPALPPRTSTQSSGRPALPSRGPSNAPSLPSRRPSETPSTASRRASEHALGRRGSNESISSIATARSAISTISNGTTTTSQSDRYSVRAPSYDASSLPPLPPKRTAEEKAADFNRHTAKSNKMAAANRNIARKNSAPAVQLAQEGTTPPPGVRVGVRQGSTGTIHEDTSDQPTTRPPKKSALLYALNDSARNAPPILARAGSFPQRQTLADPPPVPTASRPDLAALQSSKPKVNGNVSSVPTNSQPSCLLCRDYSGPDNHAARFPRESLPSHDIGWLAQQLTSPFPSATDKARALFTWLHHNIAYDTVAFFGNNVKPSTPQSTLGSGIAVCEGYAGLFAALAIKAGLEAYVISGHGKGFGYSKLRPGDPVPPYSAGHAWNVVKIDGGQWKLVDCCWGAGAVNGANRPYEKRFAPERFTQSNEDFGRDHFPGDAKNQFRTDGRVVTWEEYITGSKNGCAADFLSGYVSEEGLDATSFQPAQNPIVLAHYQQIAPTIRFSFQKCCPHWDPVRCGRGEYYMYILHLDGLDGQGRKNDIPFETNGDVWWCDVPVTDLGRPGQQARVYALTTFNGKDARGFSREKWMSRVGSWAFGGVCVWDIA